MNKKIDYLVSLSIIMSIFIATAMICYLGFLQPSFTEIYAQKSNSFKVKLGDGVDLLLTHVSLSRQENNDKNLLYMQSEGLLDKGNDKQKNNNVIDDNMNSTIGTFVIKPLDKFGIEKIYPSKPEGREWYVNMDSPYDDNNFMIRNIDLEKQFDGSWQVGSSDISGKFNDNYHIIMGVNTAPGEEEWKNVEITGYVKVVSTSHTNNAGLQWYARGANHTSEAPCEGTSLKGRILVDGTVGWKKEIWHDGGYTDQKATNYKDINSILNRWIGWKVVIYNINNDTAVKMESYIDDKNNNDWKKVTDFVDNGRWYASSSDKVFYSADCGKPKDYIVTNSGPIAAFRSDGVVWNFKNLSIREIQPFVAASIVNHKLDG